MTFPYKRTPGVCELCGADVGEENLETVTTAEPRIVRTIVDRDPSEPAKTWRDKRVLYVCDRHAQDGPFVEPRAARRARRANVLSPKRFSTDGRGARSRGEGTWTC